MSGCCAGVQVPTLRPAKHPGVRSGFELAMRFHLWASKRHQPLTWEAISAEFNVTRSTAYRWRAEYLAALGTIQ